MSISFFSYQAWNLLSVSPHFVDLNLGCTSSKTLKPTLRFARWHELSPLTALAYRDPRGTTDAVLRVTYRCKCRRNFCFQFSPFSFPFSVYYSNGDNSRATDSRHRSFNDRLAKVESESCLQHLASSRNFSLSAQATLRLYTNAETSKL